MTKSLIDEIEKCNSLYKKFANTKIVAKKLKITESSVKKYIKFSRLHKSIQDIIFEPSVSDLTQKQTISILLRTCECLGYGDGEIPDEKFMGLYHKFLEIECDDNMKRQHANRIGRQNIGQLCPECESTKQAIHSGDEIEKLDPVLKLAFELEDGKKIDRESIPCWQCVDCGHGWQGGMTII